MSLFLASDNAERLSQAWYAHNDAWMTDSDRGKLKLVAELLCTALSTITVYTLDLFSADEVDVPIEFSCTT